MEIRDRRRNKEGGKGKEKEELKGRDIGYWGGGRGRAISLSEQKSCVRPPACGGLTVSTEQGFTFVDPALHAHN
jgi:hypothetical protein